MKGADTDAVLLGENQPFDANILDHLGPVTAVLPHAVGEHLSAKWVEIADDRDAEIGTGEFVGEDGSQLVRHQFEGFFVHGVSDVRRGVAVLNPAEGVHGAGIGARVSFQPAFDQSADGALGTADRAMQQEDTFLDAVPHRAAFEGVDQFHDRFVEAEDRLFAVVIEIVKEVVVSDFFAVLGVLSRAIRHDHVVKTLEGVASHLGILPDDFEILGKRPFPMFFLEVLDLLVLASQLDQLSRVLHELSLHATSRFV